MFVFVTKLLSLFVHPLSLGLFVIIAGVISAVWWAEYGLGIVGGGLLIIWLASTPLFADWLQWTLESRYPPTRAENLPTAGAIVTLGGSVGAPQPPRVYPDLTGASDRVWHAARLFHAERAPIILASGGTLPWKDHRFREAPVIQRLLSSWGVPADSVYLESKRANTYQNAVHTADLLARLEVERVLLVTSALHMRRALATFRQVGIRAIPAATDYRSVATERTILDLLPASGALTRSTAAIREYVGYIVYDIRGWVAVDSSATLSPPTGATGQSERAIPFCA